MGRPSQDLNYPSYDEPLLSAYGGRYESAYVILHPFKRKLEDDSTAPYRQSAVASETGLPSPAEINHGLLTMIAALKPEFKNPTAAAALEGFLTRSGSVSMPTEGEFPLALRADIAHAFRSLSLDRVAFAPEFHPFDPMEELRLEDLWATDEAPPFRGTLTDCDQTLLFTVDWDSFFTLFYGPRAFVTAYVAARHIEGFFVDTSTTHTWWRPSTPAAP